MRKVLTVAILSASLAALPGCQPSRESGQPPTSVAGQRFVSAADTSRSERLGAAADVSVRDDHRPLLVCFGDSLTAGYGTNPGQSYPDYLQRDLDRLHYGYRVVNRGVSGNTTKDGLARLPEVISLHPAVVVVEFGGNDGLRGLPNADTRANLDRIVGTLQQSGSRVVLAGITLPPDYGADYVNQFDETYSLVAKKYHVPMMPFLLKDVYGVPGMMQRDEMHATAAGNQVVAQDVLNLVAPLLRK